MFSVSFALTIRFLTIIGMIYTHSHVNVNAWDDGLSVAKNRLINFETIGGIAGNNSLSTCWANTLLLNQTFGSLQNGDTLLIPTNRTFWLMGGLYARGLSYVTIQIDGILKFSDNVFEWPRDPYTNQVFNCFYFEQLDHVTFTSSEISPNKGIIDGSGHFWWGVIQYVIIRGNRPQLFWIHNSTN
ncbi:unnamed protein product, partial [Rotaria magnacalcarata]